MKKAKIMLLTIAVFAVVGGALAFKANKNTQVYYCFNTTQPVAGQDNETTCEFTSDLGFRAVKVNPEAIHYTTVLGTWDNCDLVTCPTTAETIVQEP